jgi:hypothetical protein
MINFLFILKEERKANCELTDYLHAQKIDLHFNNDPTLKTTLKSDIIYQITTLAYFNF